jgi:hypothetical protein
VIEERAEVAFPCLLLFASAFSEVVAKQQRANGLVHKHIQQL